MPHSVSTASTSPVPFLSLHLLHASCPARAFGSFATPEQRRRWRRRWNQRIHAHAAAVLHGSSIVRPESEGRMTARPKQRKPAVTTRAARRSSDYAASRIEGRVPSFPFSSRAFFAVSFLSARSAAAMSCALVDRRWASSGEQVVEVGLSRMPHRRCACAPTRTMCPPPGHSPSAAGCCGGGPMQRQAHPQLRQQPAQLPEQLAAGAPRPRWPTTRCCSPSWSSWAPSSPATGAPPRRRSSATSSSSRRPRSRAPKRASRRGSRSSGSSRPPTRATCASWWTGAHQQRSCLTRSARRQVSQRPLRPARRALDRRTLKPREAWLPQREKRLQQAAPGFAAGSER